MILDLKFIEWTMTQITQMNKIKIMILKNHKRSHLNKNRTNLNLKNWYKEHKKFII